MPDLSDVTRGRIVYGGDYNPEQWPREVWREDVTLMREAGVNLVTVGVFSWGQLEPRPGERTFGWLDEVLDLLHDGGIRVALATPTASPPPWMSHRHPETLQVTDDGSRLAHGSRNHFCPSSPIYRQYATALVGDLARRYADHPALTLWHLGNEFCEVCYCDVSAAHFRDWLRTRYGDLDALNAAWHTAFWSQHYGDWAEIVPPRRGPYLRNPTHQIDYRRFCSDALLDCLKAERAILRAATPHVPITSNFMGLGAPLDYWKAAAEQDIVSHDWYPDLSDPEAHVLTAMSFDLMRSLAGHRPWFLMEQSTSATNGPGRNIGRPPGQLRTQSLQAVARGSDAVCFFQWRASPAGAESYHPGMVPHAGRRSRIFREVTALGAELGELDAVVGTDVRADVAIVLDWNSWWATRIEHHPSDDIDVLTRLREFYTPLWRLGVTADFVPPSADLTGYRLVLIPSLYLVSAADAAAIDAYARGGGTVVVGFFSGIVDEHDHVGLGGYPAPWRDLLGLRIEEFLPQPRGATLACTSPELGDFTADFWADDIEVTGAEVVATVTDGPLAGLPVVLRNARGAGTAWYLATRPEPTAMRELLARITTAAGIAPVLDTPLPDGVEAVRRGELLFLINHGTTPTKIALPGPHHDLLTGETTTGAVELGRYGVRVLREGVTGPGVGGLGLGAAGRSGMPHS